MQEMLLSASLLTQLNDNRFCILLHFLFLPVSNMYCSPTNVIPFYSVEAIGEDGEEAYVIRGNESSGTLRVYDLDAMDTNGLDSIRYIYNEMLRYMGYEKK